jgi:ribosomal protein L11 methyltransferase
MPALAGFAELTLERRDVEDEDWARRSQAHLQPVRVGRIVVAPPWAADEATRSIDRAPDAVASRDLVLVILPSMGFGSGHHATTRACLALLQGSDVNGRTVVDVGTGSGILAIAAARLGARSVLAIDADQDALDNARENLTLNGLVERSGKIELRLADFRALDLPPADLLLANLTASSLVDQADLLLRAVAPDGRLIASGFGPADEVEVVSALAAREGVKVERRIEEDDWVGIELRR